MSSRTLLNLTLAAVALLLALVVFYQPGLEQGPVAPPISTLSADSISSIRVTRKERTPLTFTKTASGWKLLQEQALPASAFQLRALLSMPATRPRRSYPVSALDLGSAGLEPPQATLLLDDTLITIGNTEPLERTRYIRHDNTIYLVTDIYQHLINADWTNFIARQLLPENAALKSIELPGLTLTLGDEQQWQTAPAVESGNATAIQALVSQWQTASATYIRRYDGTATDATITLTFSDDTDTITLYINKQPSELVLARPDWGLQYHFPANMRSTLLGLPAPETASEIATDPLQPDSTVPHPP